MCPSPDHTLAFLDINLNRCLPLHKATSTLISLSEWVGNDLPFPDAYLEQANKFLIHLRPLGISNFEHHDIIHELIPSTGNRSQGFVERMLSIVASKSTSLRNSALSTLSHIISDLPPPLIFEIVQTNFFSRLLSILKPLTLKVDDISHTYILEIYNRLLSLQDESSLSILNDVLEISSDEVQETLLNNIFLPSKEYLQSAFLNSRSPSDDQLYHRFCDVLVSLVALTPLYQPTAQFIDVLDTPFMTMSSFDRVDTDNPFAHFYSRQSIIHRELLENPPEWAFAQFERYRRLKSEGLDDLNEQRLITERRGFNSVSIAVKVWNMLHNSGANIWIGFVSG